MRYFPISVDLEDRPVLVVGGGEVAQRRIDALLECEANITVVSPEVSERIAALAEAGDIALHLRPYGRGDTAGMMLVLTATDDPKANAAVWEEAKASGVLVNTADEPSRCDFIIPAMVRRGDLSIADTPAAVVSKGTAEGQDTRVGILDTIASLAGGIPSPAVIVFGPVVLERRRLSDLRRSLEN